MAKGALKWLVVGAIIVTAALIFGRKQTEGVRVPKDPSEVLERVPSSSTNGKELKALEASVRERPDDVARATSAARKAIELARREADPRYWGRAQAALGQWWTDIRPPDEVLILRATIRQAQHDFDGARADLLELQNDPQARLTLATVEMVTGRYASAASACGALVGQVDALVSTVCSAQVDSLTGRAAAAVTALQAALEQAGPANPQRAWGLSVLGELAERAGDDAGAEKALREALVLGPDDGYTLNALADLLLAIGRGAEVDALLSSRFTDDNSLLRLAIAERLKLGKPGSYAQMLRWRYQASQERGDAVHLREYARFALEVEGSADRALDFATKNWAVQREPADARIALMAALAAGKPQAAHDVAAFLKKNGAEEPRLVALVKKVSE